MTMWKNGTIKNEYFDMDYIEFGSGTKPLILIPGLGDGLRTVKGLAMSFSLMYRSLGSAYRVYVFSCRNNIEEGHTTRNMASDLAAAMELLGISKAHVVGVSQGGMTAQWLACNYPQLVDRMILTVTSDHLEPEYCKGIETWMEMAQEGRYGDLMVDTAEKSYTEKKLKTYRPAYPVLRRVGRPESFRRFLIMAQACLEHDTSSVLTQIHCPVLVLSGGRDCIVGAEAGMRLAAGISGSQHHIYPDLGHGAYEEAKDFQKRILDFLNG